MISWTTRSNGWKILQSRRDACGRGISQVHQILSRRQNHHISLSPSRVISASELQG